MSDEAKSVMNKPKKWTEYLETEVYRRLCHCQSRKSDIPALVNAKWLSFQNAGKDKQGFTKEDALISVLDLLDSNGQAFDLTADEYSEFCR